MGKIKLRFNAGIEYKGKIYGSAIYINGLFSLDLATGEVVYIKRFTEEKPCYAIHRAAFLYGKEAWFIPQHGKYIAIVDLETFDIEYMEPPFRKINEKAVTEINSVYYSGGLIDEDYLYLVPTNIDALLLINLKDRTLHPYYNVSNEKEYFMFGTYVKGSLYLSSVFGKSVLQLNLRTNGRQYYSWKNPVKTFGEMAYSHNKLWFTPFQSNAILSVDIDTKEVSEIPLGEFYDEQYKYEQVYTCGDKLCLIPFEGNAILELDVKSGALARKELPSCTLKNGTNGFTKIYPDKSLIMASYHKSLVLIREEEMKEFQIFHLQAHMDKLHEEMGQGQAEVNFADYFSGELYGRNGVYAEYTMGIKKYIARESLSNPLAAVREDRYGKQIWKNVTVR